MERDDQLFRYTRMVLLVEWDPTTNDHPLGWDWEMLLEKRVDVLEGEDQEPVTSYGGSE